MHNSADAERARERLHGTVVEGRKIEVCMMLFLPIRIDEYQLTLNEMLFNLSQCAYL
jgi:hypothetical protein